MIHTLDTIIQDAQTFHARLAKTLYPHGGILRCEQCGHTHAFTTADAARYLQSGWARHCGCTMTAIPAPDARARINARQFAAHMFRNSRNGQTMKTTRKRARKPNTDHVVTDFSVTPQQFVCRHCGETSKIILPMPLDEFVKRGEAFVALHQFCKPRTDAQLNAQ